MMRSVRAKPVFYASAAALGLAFAAWASTSVSFTWKPEPPDPAVLAERARAAAEAERRRNYVPVVDYKRIDERLGRLMQDERMVGLAVGIVENGEIRFLKGYGTTFAGGAEPVTPNTIFRWASLSKGVAADLVVKLAEENRLSLYDPVAKYAFSLRLPAGAEHKATVSDLLSHRLGLFSHANDSKLEDGGDARLLRANLATLNAICPPSNCHAYQNVAYDAASEIVEKVTGKPYGEAVQERLFQPLGMTSASLSRDGLIGARSWARPHRGGKNSKPVEVTDSYYRVPAAGGVNSSIKDLATWMIAQMGEDPEVISGKVLASLHSPRAYTPGELARKRKFRERLNRADYGLGWRVYDYSGNRVIGHHGGVTGYRSLIMFDPARKAGVVALWNSGSNQPSGLEFEVMDMIYKLPTRDWLGVDDSRFQQKIQKQKPAEPAKPLAAVSNVAS
jgi:beta-lactamase class C